MATGSIILTPGSAVPPDGSASNAAPAIQRVQSSGASPKPHFLQAAFDAGTDEFLHWTFRMPPDYASAPVLVAQGKMASATTGNVILSGRVAAVTPGDATDVDAKAYATVNTSSATAVPGTAGHLFSISITLTNADSLAANDLVMVSLARDADNAGDTAAGDYEFVAAALTYTTT